jgi:AcrR family transcriptional regulator
MRDGAAAEAPTFRLGGADVVGPLHVCGLIDGADDAYAQLAPFIAEGIALGQRGVHVIDGRVADEHATRLAAAGIDAAAAIDRGLLQIRTWDELYLVDGRFRAELSAAYAMQILDTGRANGFTASRAIGFMGWAAADPPGVDQIATYEVLLNTRLAARQDAVICVYDVRRQRPRVIVDALATHPYALVDGQLTARSTRSEPRERILRAASRLFHREGIGATGVDRVIAEANVAKATFYRQFRAKEDLVLAWLTQPSTRWFDRVFETAQRAPSRADVVPAIFDALATWLEEDDFRGCPYQNTVSELAGTPAEHRVRAAATAGIDEIGERVRRTAATAGVGLAAADQIHVLFSGAIELAVAYRSTVPVSSARAAAVALLGGRGKLDS